MDSTVGERRAADAGDGTDTVVRVLWVGDETVSPERVREALRAALDRGRGSDAALDRVDSLDAALDRLEQERVDGLVLAVPEPAAALERVRDRGRHLPVVLVASAGTSVGGARLDRNASLFVPGPDAPAALATAIADALTGDEETGQPIQALPTDDELRLKERAMDEAPVGITIADMSRPDSPLIYANEAFEAVTGYPPAAAVGRNCRFLQGPGTDPETVDEIREAIETGEPTTVELRNYRRDGEEFWNRLQVSPLYDGDEVSHYVGFQTDVSDRKRMELALRRERERLDHLVGRLYGLVTDTTEVLTAADSRTEIEREVATRFGTDEEYALAWVGQHDRSTGAVTPVEAGGLSLPDDREPFDLDAAEPAAAALAAAVEACEPVVADEGLDRLTLGAPVTDVTSVAVVPLVHREAVYDVLVVAGTDRGLFEGRDRDVLSVLGRSIGSAINAVGSKRLITTDTAVSVTVAFETADTFPFWLSAQTDCDLAYETSRYDPDGKFVALFTVSGADAASVCAVADADDRVAEARTLAETDAGAVVQFRLPDAPLVRLLTDYGAHLEDITAAAGGGRLAFEASDETAARAIVERLRETHGAELVAYREGAPGRATITEFQSTVERRLTERQSTALRRAYASGFFEWPRDVDGERLAEAMGVSPPTFHQHLRAAERKVFTELFES